MSLTVRSGMICELVRVIARPNCRNLEILYTSCCKCLHFVMFDEQNSLSLRKYRLCLNLLILTFVNFVEIANVNFLYDDIVHALQNAIDSCINSTTDRFLQRKFTKFSEITQCNGHYAVQGHSRSPILVIRDSLL